MRGLLEQWRLECIREERLPVKRTLANHHSLDAARVIFGADDRLALNVLEHWMDQKGMPGDQAAETFESVLCQLFKLEESHLSLGEVLVELDAPQVRGLVDHLIRSRGAGP